MRRLAVVAAAVAVLGLASPAAAQDWQLWTAAAARVDFGEGWAGHIEEEVRLGDDMSRLVQHHLDVGVSHRTLEWLELAVHHRYIRRVKNDEWETENRPHVNATVFWEWVGLSFSNRARMEHRFLSHTKNFSRFRDRLRIELPEERSGWPVVPFLSGETFVDFDQDGFNFNRIAAGIEAEFRDWITGEAYYLRQTGPDRGTEPPSNVLGLTLNLRF